MPIITAPHPLSDRPILKHLLEKLHTLSLEQEKETSARGSHFPKALSDHEGFKDQLVALDEDKAQAMYLILRTMGAKRIVEAGTSYGVSLLWLLAAVTANEEKAHEIGSNELPSLVIGTEYEAEKADRALQHVKEGFGGLPSCLELLRGDLLKTLVEANLPDRSIDALLLDIWSELALPTLKIILPKLRIGGAVFIDNTIASAERYEDLFRFIREPKNGFQVTTLPYSGGFDICVYTP